MELIFRFQNASLGIDQILLKVKVGRYTLLN